MPPRKRKDSGRQAATKPLAADSPGPSSLVTDANSSLSGKPRGRQSASSNNNDHNSDIRPASPQSFSSQNVDLPFLPRPLPAPQQNKKPRFDTDFSHHNQMIYQQLMNRHELPPLQQQQPQRFLPPRSVNINPQFHETHPPSGPRLPVAYESCMERLKQYISDLRRRPADNSILFWRRLIGEYYAPRARQRWCFSSYDDVAGCQAIKAAWGCEICGTMSGKGFEATFEILPRLSQIKFDHGVIDELFFLGMPRERRLSSGVVVLEFAKAVQESIYAQQRAVHEGQLRIIFTPGLKILSWEFCVRRHEEFLCRSSLAPQINLYYGIVHKYQTATAESGSSGLSPQELQNFCNMFMTAGDLLARSLKRQSLTGLGLSKGFAFSLQMAETAGSMKDLFDISQNHKIGPIESLKKYAQQDADKNQCLTRASANLYPSQLQPGLSQQPSLGTNFPQLNDTGLSNVSHPMKSDLVRQVPTNMVNTTKEAPMQSLSDPSAGGVMEGEAASGSSGGNTGRSPAMINSRATENGSGSVNSMTSVANDASGTKPSENCGHKPVAKSNSSPSSDSTVASSSIPGNRPSELDSFWKDLIDNGFFDGDPSGLGDKF